MGRLCPSPLGSEARLVHLHLPQPRMGGRELVTQGPVVGDAGGTSSPSHPPFWAKTILWRHLSTEHLLHARPQGREPWADIQATSVLPTPPGAWPWSSCRLRSQPFNYRDGWRQFQTRINAAGKTEHGCLSLGTQSGTEGVSEKWYPSQGLNQHPGQRVQPVQRPRGWMPMSEGAGPGVWNY